ncbi:MAG: ABC transporter permease [Eubacterium sp.]|nr:ABC transporter permease [Eubacterium sp.]
MSGRYYLKKALRDPQFILFLILAVILILIPVFAPYIAPNDPIKTDYDNLLIDHSDKYPLGTDQIGRCFLSRLIYGGRMSLLIVFIVIAISAVIGITLGIIAGYAGGKVDTLIARITDIFMAVPQTVFVIALVSVLGTNMRNTILAMSVVSWTEYCRVTRALVLSLKENPYVEEGRLGGMSELQIIFKLILPNAFPYLLVNITQDIGGKLLTLSGLSLLGLSAQPPTPEWGYMLSEGRIFIQANPRLILYPGLTIVMNVVVFNLLGDSLRDVLDPRFVRKKHHFRRMREWLNKA